MDRRSRRDLWCLLAGLPGVATPFLSFSTGSWVESESPFSVLKDHVNLRDGDWSFLGLALPMFLPIATSIWQARRWRQGVPAAWERRASFWLAAFSLAISTAFFGMFLASELIGGKSEFDLREFMIWALPLLLVAANIVLFVRNRRRRIPLVNAVECFLLGAYLAHALPVLTVFALELDVGGALVAMTCAVYAATIFVRARSPARPAVEAS